MELLNSYAKNSSSIISQFDEQDKFLLTLVKSKNYKKAKILIAEYELSNPLNGIFIQFTNDYDKLQEALRNILIKRQEELRNLLENL
jgi:hypothetical protein